MRGFYWSVMLPRLCTRNNLDAPPPPLPISSLSQQEEPQTDRELWHRKGQLVCRGVRCIQQGPGSVRSVRVQPDPCPRQGVSRVMILCLSPISSEGWVTHGFLSHQPTGDTECWSLEYTTTSFLPGKSFSASSGTRGPGGPLDN